MNWRLQLNRLLLTWYKWRHDKVKRPSQIQVAFIDGSRQTGIRHDDCNLVRDRLEFSLRCYSHCRLYDFWAEGWKFRWDQYSTAQWGSAICQTIRVPAWYDFDTPCLELLSATSKPYIASKTSKSRGIRTAPVYINQYTQINPMASIGGIICPQGFFRSKLLCSLFPFW